MLATTLLAGVISIVGTETGLDVLRAQAFRPLAGKRIGLLTNHTGKARDGRTGVDLLASAPDLQLRALFSPEHGIRGELDTKVASGIDTATGLPIHSLYGDAKRPAPRMLEGLDTLVIDLQDAGARFYTYMSTMGYLMEAAATLGLEVCVLDRPNPLNGVEVEGPSLAADELGFTAYFPMPVRHGMTLGELARLFDGERQDPALRLGPRLRVIAMQHWSRAYWFDACGLEWTDPSPNLRSVVAASLYPGVATIEGANVSVGRGTDRPFEQIGAPWVDGPQLAARLNTAALPGLRAYPVSFTPRVSKFSAERCHGVGLIVTERAALRPVRLGLELAAALHAQHAGTFALETISGLFGRQVVQQLRAGKSSADIASGWQTDEAAWRRLRERHLLYG
ncbi:MAG: DUF1343 domain-containing protein [Gammaproteobacteria bacterium]|nr:DUF1343 domain-containing protein [Gammaproteobacteria bacterium]